MNYLLGYQVQVWGTTEWQLASSHQLCLRREVMLELVAEKKWKHNSSNDHFHAVNMLEPSLCNKDTNINSVISLNETHTTPCGRTLSEDYQKEDSLSLHCLPIHR